MKCMLGFVDRSGSKSFFVKSIVQLFYVLCSSYIMINIVILIVLYPGAGVNWVQL